MTSLTLRVNAREETVSVEPRTHLADCLRDELLLTGTHLGCEHGVCGACTLMLDGMPVRSCLTLAATCAGADVRTIEGFDDDALMAALRSAFSRHHALQCGYCTPGMLVTAYDIVRRLPTADETRIRTELAGNLCRCTGYAGIVAAIMDVLQDPPAADLVPMPRTAHVSVDRRVGFSPPLLAPQKGGPRPTLRSENELLIDRTVPLTLSAGQAWPLLRSIEQVASFLPGAAITSLDGDQVQGAMTAAVGPIRATFTGQADIRYDDAGRTGVMTGHGHDRWTRSAVDGTLRFSLHPAGPDACTLKASIAYRLKGPLSQFGRPAVVAGVVDQLLNRFTANLLAAASGTKVDEAPIGVVRSLLRWLFRARRSYGAST